MSRVSQLQKYLLHMFIAGLTFSGFGCVLGIILNSASVLHIDSAFYLIGVAIYAIILTMAIF